MAAVSRPAPEDIVHDQPLSRLILMALTEAERQERLDRLREDIDARLRDRGPERSIAQEVAAIIGELRLLGHDIWHHDFDDDWQTWGSDYMKPPRRGQLMITFRYRETSQVAWRDSGERD